MSYDHAISNLYKLGHELSGTSHKFDLDYVRVLLRELGNPERRFHSVLIAGTNGKGSTAATLASILQAAVHRTGLYTSPHLVRINERISVNSCDIPDDDFARVYDRVEAAAQKLVAEKRLPWHPSFFEMLTAMAFQHFADTHVDIAVLEVGMGGRLDATNVVDPLVSVITDISLDHQKYLGNTITEIAREKAGIIRPNGVAITLPQHPEANSIIGNTALEGDARLITPVQYVPPVSPGAARRSNSYNLDVMGQQITVDSPLHGRHQLRNIALAISAAEELNHILMTVPHVREANVGISPQAIETGIRQTRWRGRFQVLPAASGRPEMVLDGAHNPAGAWALRSVLNERFPDRPITLVFGMMRDKALNEVTEILFPLAQQVIATKADNPRSATPKEIHAAASRISTTVNEAQSVAEALATVFALSKTREPGSPEPLVVIAGSIYIVGEALAALERPESPSQRI